MPGALDRRLHGAERSIAALHRRRDMIGVPRHPIADDLGVDACAPRALACSYSSRTTAPAPSPMTKPSRSLSKGREPSFGRSLKPVDRARDTPRKAGDADPVDRADSAPPATITSASPNAISRDASPMAWVLGRASRHDGVVRPPELVHDRHVAAGQVDDAPGHEERRHPPGSLLLQDRPIARRCRRGHRCRHPKITPVRRSGPRSSVGFQSGVGQSLGRGTNGENDEVVDLALLFRLHPLASGLKVPSATIAARHLHGDAAGEVGRSQSLRSGPAPLLPASEEARPRFLIPRRPSGVTSPRPVTTTLRIHEADLD